MQKWCKTEPENQLQAQFNQQKSDSCSAPQGKKGKVGLPSPWQPDFRSMDLEAASSFLWAQGGRFSPWICKSANINLCSHTAAEKQTQQHKADESSSHLNFTQLKARARRSKLKIAAKNPHKTLNFCILIWIQTTHLSASLKILNANHSNSKNSTLGSCEFIKGVKARQWMDTVYWFFPSHLELQV